MSVDLQTLMRKASRLTRIGEPQQATRLIQRSLGTVTPMSRTGTVVDPQVVFEGMAQRHRHPGDSDVPPVTGESGTSQQVTHARHVHRGLDLAYRLFEPVGFEGRRPLLVMLHGCTQHADDFAIGTDMDRLAQLAGVHVLYPTQSAMRNSRQCWNWFEPAHQQRDLGEAGALHALTRMIAARPQIDESRVFVAGLSAGGAMALVLAEHYPELFLGVGVHSGLPTNVACSIPQALAAMQGKSRGVPRGVPPHARSRTTSRTRTPVIVFHGTSDPIVHPVNAEHIVAARVARANTTVETVRGSVAGRRFARHIHRTSRSLVACEQWELFDAGHQWSGGNPAGSHTDPAGPSASREMLRFFLDLPGA